MSRANITIWREDGEPRQIIVSYHYRPASKGEREAGTGLAISPDTSEELDVYDAHDLQGVEVELTETEKDAIRVELLETGDLEKGDYES